MIIVLGDLLADISMRLSELCIEPKDLQRLSYLEVGPGGAANVAIMARRFDMAVLALGEVGDDIVGRMLLEGLEREGIETSQIMVSPETRTPVAAVLVDERSEPAYLGFSGTLSLSAVPDLWRAPIRSAQALFSDGWVEHAGAADLILEAFHLARNANVPIFFDPGPGNPDVDNAWHREAASLCTVLLANEEEAARLSQKKEPQAAGRSLLELGPEIVVVKRGAAGAILFRGNEMEVARGLPVEARDATGAGDSFAGALLFGYQQGLTLEALGTLGNATGAAKVQKAGTGHNMPEVAEVQEVLKRFDLSVPGVAF